MGILGDTVKNRYLYDIPGILCNNMSQEEMKRVITGEMCRPEYNFNVFSIAKRLQSGWVLSGNDKNIIQGHELRVIVTKSGTKMSIQHAHKLLGH